MADKTTTGNSTEPIAGAVSAEPLSRAELAILIVGFGAYFFSSIPGNLGIDGSGHLCQGRAWQFGDWHPVFNSLYMSIGDWIVPGPFIYFLTCYAGLAIGCTLLAKRILPERSPTRLGLFVVLAFNPAIHGLFFEIFKDNLQVAFLLVGLGLLFGQPLSRRRWEALRALGAFGLVAAAVWTRHNTVLLAPVVVVYWWVSQRGLSTWWKLGCVLAFVAATAMPRLIPLHREEHPVQQIFTWDLWAMSQRLNQPFFFESHPRLRARFPQTEIQSWYRPDTNTPLIFGRGHGHFIRFESSEDLARLRSVWWKTISSHPLTYLKMRANYWLYLLQIKTPTTERGVVGHVATFDCDYAGQGNCPKRNCAGDRGRREWAGQELRFDAGFRFVTSLYNRNLDAWWMSGYLCCLIVLAAAALLVWLRKRASILIPSLFVTLCVVELGSLMFIGTASPRRYFSLSYLLCHFLLAWMINQGLLAYRRHQQQDSA